MKRLFISLALLCALAVSALATDITISASQQTNLPFNPSGIGTDRSITVTVSSGSTTVTSSAAFPAQIVGMGGFQVQLNGAQYVVASVESTSSLTLTTVYPGSSGSLTMTLYKYVVLRIYATAGFQPNGATYVVQPGTPGSGNYYKQIAVSIVSSGSNNVAYIPSFTLPATTDATITNQAKYIFGFYRPDGSFLNYYTCGNVQQIALSSLTNPTTLTAICAYNAPGGIVPPPFTAYTKQEIDARFPGCTAGQVLYFAATGTTLSCGSGSGGGITTLNGQTQTSQGFLTSTSGTDFGITSSGGFHTFALPSASASARGALSASDWSAFNAKLGGSGTSTYIPLFTGTSSIGNSTAFYSSANSWFQFGKDINVVTGTSSARLLIDSTQVVIEGSSTRSTSANMLTLKQVSSQTGDFERFNNSSGTSLWQVDKDGDPYPRGVAYAWPSASSSGILTNTSGTLTWNSAIPTSNIRQALNAKVDYGAAGDGVTDDTTALQNCLTASTAAGGKECYIPAGTYLVTGLTLVDNTHIIGDGIGKTIITSATNAAILSVSSTAFYLTIHGLTIDGNAAGASQIGLNLAGSADYSGVYISQVYIQQTGSHGLYITKAFSSSFQQMEFDSCGNTSNSWSVTVDANDHPNLTFRDIYVHSVTSTNPTAYRIKGGDPTCYNCNGMDNAASSSTWVRIGKKNGSDGDTSDLTAAFGCFQCNLESWTSYGFYAYYNSRFTCIGCTIYPNGGATSGKRVGQYEVDTSLFPAFFSRGLIDETTIIDGPESSYASGGAFHSNDQPPLRFDGSGPRILTGGSAGRVATYYDTTQSRANPVGRDGGVFARTVITASTSLTRTGVRYIEANCSAPCTITLPYAGWYDGVNAESVWIKDISGGAGTNNITVQADGGSTVNGTTYTINQNGQAIVVIPSSTANDWRVLSNSATSVTGSGTSPRLAYWSGSTALTSTSGYEVDTGNAAIKSGGRFWGENVTAGAPTFSFTNDNDTGIYRSAANTIGLATGGTQRGAIGDTFDLYPYGGGAGQTGTVRLYDSDASAYVGLRAADTTTTYTITFPAAAPGSTQCLQMSSAGVITATGSGCAGAAGANTSLDNLAAVSINTALIPQTGVDLGAAATAFRFLYLYGSGSFATTSLKFTGTPTGNRTITFPDATDTVAVLGTAQTWTANQTYGSGILRATSPRVTTDISDSNGNELFKFTATASAVNEFTVANNSTGNAPTLSATGGDTNIHILITPKGTGQVGITNPPVITGYTASTAADGTILIIDSTSSITKNDSNTRTFYGTKFLSDLNTGVSNSNTTFNLIYGSTTVTGSTGVTTNLLRLDYASAEKFSIGSSGAMALADGVRQTFNPDGTNSGLNVGSQAGDPSSLSNGDVWYNSSTHLLKARVNGAAIAVAPADPSYVTLGTNSILSSERVLTGTSNQVTVTDGGAGTTVTLSTPQNLDTSALFQVGALGVGTTAPSAGGIDVLGKTVNTDATNTVGGVYTIFSLTKNSANTRTFHGNLIKPTLNTGGSNANTTLNVLSVDTTNTATTGVTTNLLRLAYGGTDQLTVSSTGQVAQTGVAFASLGTPSNGSLIYCSDCTVTSGSDNTCAGSGSGALAIRLNSVWRCFNAQN